LDNRRQHADRGPLRRAPRSNIDGSALHPVARQSIDIRRVSTVVPAGLMNLDEGQSRRPDPAIDDDLHLLAAPTLKGLDRQSRPATEKSTGTGIHRGGPAPGADREGTGERDDDLRSDDLPAPRRNLPTHDPVIDTVQTQNRPCHRSGLTGDHRGQLGHLVQEVSRDRHRPRPSGRSRHLNLPATPVHNKAPRSPPVDREFTPCGQGVVRRGGR
jgi:hypothetical protein